MAATSPHTTQTLQATFDRVVGSFAMLKNTEYGGVLELPWPMNKMPQELKEGDQIMLSAHTISDENEEKYERMRKLLEELIN